MKVTGRPVAGLVFRASPTLSLYGTVGRGFENPTLVEIANRDIAGTGPNLNLAISSNAPVSSSRRCRDARPYLESPTSRSVCPRRGARC